MTRAEAILPALIFAVVATLLALGNFVYDYSWVTFTFPLGVGLVLCALCAGEIVRLLRSAAPSAAGLQGTAAGVPAEDASSYSLAGLAWTFALGLFLYAFGFVAGPALYLLVCLWANGASWLMALGIAVASIAVTWGLFIKVLGVLLPLMPLWLP